MVGNFLCLCNKRIITLLNSSADDSKPNKR